MSSTAVVDERWKGASAVAEFLETPEGQTALRRAAAGHRLGPAFVDELRQLVEDEAMRMDRLGKPIDSPAGFAVKVMRDRAIDQVRAQVRRRRRFVDPLPAGDDGEAAAIEELLGHEDPGFVALENEAHLGIVRRAALDARMDVRDWQRSALLTFISVRVTSLEPGHRCPRPLGGTTPHHAALWASLHYAGRRACLPTAPGDDSQARRKARSRDMAAIADAQAHLRTLVGGSGV